MELIKPHHKPSVRVTRKNLNEAVKEAYALANFLEEGNKNGFTGNWKRAVGISHCQVSETPFAFFAISSEMVGKSVKHTRQQNARNFWFPAQVIFNAEIIEALDEIERIVPKKNLIKGEKKGEFSVEVTKQAKMVSNMLEAPDACMSYPNRSKKNTKRYHTIVVRYQILRSFLGFKWLKTVVEEVESFKAHVFQHEIDHSFGIDMYFGDGEDRQVEKPYKNAGAEPDKTA